MISSLGMYDMPAIQPANDRFWALIRANLGLGPHRLNRDLDLWEMWQSPDLLLGHTCGLPYRAKLHQTVEIVGTLDYALPGCPPGHYNSHIVVRADAPGNSERDFDGGIFAFNDAMSQSGWAGPMSHLNALGLEFASHLATGAHVDSAHAIAAGIADIAGIDAMTWRLLQEHDPVVTQLKVIASIDPTPGLPLITAKSRDVAPIATAVRAAIRDLDPVDRAALHIRDMVDVAPSAYLSVPAAPTPKAKRGVTSGHLASV